MSFLDKTGVTLLWNKIQEKFASKDKGIYYIAGTGSTAGTWLGSHDEITSYYDGLTIAYKIGIAGASTTTLNINSLGAKTVRRCTGNMTTHLPVNTVVILVYTTISNTGYWVWADYNANTTNSAGSANTSSKIFLIGRTSQSSTGGTSYSHDTAYVGTDGCLYSNSTKVSVEGHTHDEYEPIKTTTTLYSTSTAIYSSTLAAGNVKSASITLTDSVQAGDKLKVYVYGGSSYPTMQAGIIELSLYSPTSTTLVGQGSFISVSGGQKLIIGAEVNSTSAATTSSLKINVYTLAASDYAAASYVYVNKVERIR